MNTLHDRCAKFKGKSTCHKQFTCTVNSINGRVGKTDSGCIIFTRGFDIHRDALLNSENVYKVITYDESTPAAQIMLVVGTDSAGASHPGWRKNLSFAVNAQYLLTKRLENLMRPICIKKSSYNQQLSPGALLIEVGPCANTLAEAKTSAEILGETLAALINSDG